MHEIYSKMLSHLKTLSHLNIMIIYAKRNIVTHKKSNPKKNRSRKKIELKKNLSQKKRTKINKNAQIHNHQPQTSKNVRSHFPLCSPFNYDQIACDEWRTCNITPQYAKTTEITIFRDFKWIGIINVFVGFFFVRSLLSPKRGNAKFR